MALHISLAPGYANPFNANLCPQESTATLPLFFGALGLEVTADAPAQFIEVTMAVKSGHGGFGLYGPTKGASLGTGQKIPIGVSFFARRMRKIPTPPPPPGWSGASLPGPHEPYLEPDGRTSMTVTATWLEGGSPNRLSTHLDVTAQLSWAPTIFTLQKFDLAASPVASKQAHVALWVEQQGTRFDFLPPLPPANAFSNTALAPGGTFNPGRGPAFDLNFDVTQAARDARVVTIVGTAANASKSQVPIISWCAEGPVRGDLVISGIDYDPQGEDLPSESITVQNVSSRRLHLYGCTLHDEGQAPPGQPRNTFGFPPGAVLDPGKSFRIWSKAGTNTGTDLFWGRAAPVWNDDFDTAVLLNAGNDEIDRRSYVNPSMGPGLAGQTALIDNVFTIDQAFDSVPIVRIEDGDFVVIDADPNARSWAGDWTIGWTGPNGDAHSNAPDNGRWPLPGAPKFALLAASGNYVALNGHFQQLVNREPRGASQLIPGLLSLEINDDVHGGGMGQYRARVQVFRK